MANGDGSGNGNGYVRVSNREIYDRLLDVNERLSGLERRVDSVLSENVGLRKKVRQLELRFYAILAGLVAALTLIATGDVPKL